MERSNPPTSHPLDDACGRRIATLYQDKKQPPIALLSKEFPLGGGCGALLGPLRNVSLPAADAADKDFIGQSG